MINNYDYEEGKIIALDDKKGTKEFEYQDNIDDIIATENVIEVLNNEIDEIANKFKLNDKKNICLFIFFMAATFAICGLLSHAIIPSLLIANSIGSIIVDSILGIILLFFQIALAVFSLNEFKDNKEENKELEYEKKELEYERDFQKEMLKEYSINMSKNLEYLYKNKNFNKLLFIRKMNKELKIIRESIAARKYREKTKVNDVSDKIHTLKKVNNKEN